MFYVAKSNGVESEMTENGYQRRYKVSGTK